MGTAMSQLICSFHSHFRSLWLETLSNACNVNSCTYFLFSHLKGHNTLRRRAVSYIHWYCHSLPRKKCRSCADLHQNHSVINLLPLWRIGLASISKMHSHVTCFFDISLIRQSFSQSLTLIQGVFSRTRRTGWHFCLHLSLFLECNHIMWF